MTDQAKVLLRHIAGYASHRTVGMGLRCGLVEALADHPAGLRPEDLADPTGTDPFSVGVWP